MKPYMSKDELIRRRKDGASLTTLAELNGCKPEDIRAVLESAKRPALPDGMTGNLEADLLNPAVSVDNLSKVYRLTAKQINDKRSYRNRRKARQQAAPGVAEGKRQGALATCKMADISNAFGDAGPKLIEGMTGDSAAAPLPKPLPRAEWLEQRELALAAWLMWQIGQRQPLDRELLAELEAMQETSGCEHDAG